MTSITTFQNEYSFLSNFHPFETPLTYLDLSFPTNEHFYTAMKTTNPKHRQLIASTRHPASAKKIGRTITLRQNWNHLKFQFMLFGLRYKFNKKFNPKLNQLLLNTNNMHISEGNWWNDKTWGICLRTNKGENHLGLLLMQVRSEIQQQQ